MENTQEAMEEEEEVTMPEPNLAEVETEEKEREGKKLVEYVELVQVGKQASEEIKSNVKDSDLFIYSIRSHKKYYALVFLVLLAIAFIVIIGIYFAIQND
jgi:hypothetical protein